MAIQAIRTAQRTEPAGAPRRAPDDEFRGALKREMGQGRDSVASREDRSTEPSSGGDEGRRSERRSERRSDRSEDRPKGKYNDKDRASTEPAVILGNPTAASEQSASESSPAESVLDATVALGEVSGEVAAEVESDESASAEHSTQSASSGGFQVGEVQSGLANGGVSALTEILPGNVLADESQVGSEISAQTAASDATASGASTVAGSKAGADAGTGVAAPIVAADKAGGPAPAAEAGSASLSDEMIKGDTGDANLLGERGATGANAGEPGSEGALAKPADKVGPSVAANASASASSTTSSDSAASVAAATQTSQQVSSGARIVVPNTAPEVATMSNGARFDMSTLGEGIASRVKVGERIQSLTLQLHPAELGAVRVDVRQIDGVTHLLLTPESSTGGHRLSAAMADLRHDLNRAGVNLGDLQLQQGQSEGQSRDAGQSRQSGSSDRIDGRHRSGPARRTADPPSAEMPVARHGLS
ncbi:MAG TPA: flagellar hook-length control protein FliK, partial [Microthrixaceae bacterium]|nr:flagellar hook-length control protein FliK [Microthrixaceae bacterium]